MNLPAKSLPDTERPKTSENETSLRIGARQGALGLEFEKLSRTAVHTEGRRYPSRSPSVPTIFRFQAQFLIFTLTGLKTRAAGF